MYTQNETIDVQIESMSGSGIETLKWKVSDRWVQSTDKKSPMSTSSNYIYEYKYIAIYNIENCSSLFQLI